MNVKGSGVLCSVLSFESEFSFLGGVNIIPESLDFEFWTVSQSSSTPTVVSLSSNQLKSEHQRVLIKFHA
jgi:hypothetical protein